MEIIDRSPRVPVGRDIAVLFKRNMSALYLSIFGTQFFVFLGIVVMLGLMRMILPRPIPIVTSALTIIVLLIIVFDIIYSLLRYLFWRSVTYRIDKDAIQKEYRFIFYTRVREHNIQLPYEIKLNQDFLGKLLNYGTIIIEDQKEEFALEYVPDPEQTTKIITDTFIRDVKPPPPPAPKPL